jgi:hypothetical protein
VVARARPLCSSSFGAAALWQRSGGSQLGGGGGSLLQRSVGCSHGSGQLGGSMIINKTRNNLWV